MQHFRRFIDTRRSSIALALYLSYALAIQAVLGSVGLGMSAGFGSTEFSICNHVLGGDERSPATGGDGQNQNSVPACPFCFLAAQWTATAATTADAPVLPAYPRWFIVAIPSWIDAAAHLPEDRHSSSEARAPPQFSI